jgi:tetratricopeptide (TPR) repeat protein
VISRLARLRSFHVIARGSAFALRHLAADPQAVGRALNVAHAVAGTASIDRGRVRLRLDLLRVEDGSILWTEDLSEARARFLAILPTLTERIVRSVEMQVTAAEIRRALATPEERLDAWESFHAGLHDAFRFDPDRIGRALERMRAAARLDPGFSRAHAGQSFCHYFRAFSGVAGDRAAEVAAARRTAEEALRTDEANPTAHWAYGRALWLEGDPDGCLQQSHRAVALSPGFALGHYMVGFVETHCGDPRRGLERMDRMLALSPVDPFLASVEITRAFALMRLGDLDAAAVRARDAVRQPNAYSTLFAPAALILASAGRLEEARSVVRRLREVAPGFRPEHMYRSLYCLSEDVAAQFRRHAPLIGL